MMLSTRKAKSISKHSPVWWVFLGLVVATSVARGLLPGVWFANSSLWVLYRGTTCAASVAFSCCICCCVSSGSETIGGAMRYCVGEGIRASLFAGIELNCSQMLLSHTTMGCNMEFTSLALQTKYYFLCRSIFFGCCMSRRNIHTWLQYYVVDVFVCTNISWTWTYAWDHWTVTSTHFDIGRKNVCNETGFLRRRIKNQNRRPKKKDARRLILHTPHSFLFCKRFGKITSKFCNR